MTTVSDAIDVPAGLKGVVVAETALGDVRGREGFYHYRQYSAVELAQQRSLEDVWHLMFEGALPDPDERAAFAARGRGRAAPARRGPRRAARHRRRPAAGRWTGCARRCRCSAAPAGSAPVYDVDPRSDAQDALAARRRGAHDPGRACTASAGGCEPLEPRDDLGHAAAYLYDAHRRRSPTPQHARAVEQYLMPTVDHGFNASTFTARVIASTGADVAACLVGAPRRALRARCTAARRAGPWTPWTRSAPRTGSTPGSGSGSLAGDRIMGFGHAVYRTEDPRSRHAARHRPGALGGPAACDFAGRRSSAQVVEILAELKPGRELHTNVEFYAGVVMELCGLPREMFTPTFAAARVVGWSANILEQAARLQDHPPVGPVRRPAAAPARAALLRTSRRGRRTAHRGFIRRGGGVGRRGRPTLRVGDAPHPGGRPTGR